MRIHLENRHCRLTLGIAIVALIAACRTITVPTDVSAPKVIPGGIAGRIDPDGSTTLYLSDLDLVIQVRNHRSQEVGLIWDFPLFAPFLLPIPLPVGRKVAQEVPPGDSGGPLTISMTFLPREGGFTFDPGTLAVTPEGGNVVPAVEFIGPIETSCTGAWAKAETSRGYSLPPGNRTCFVIRFPLHASPETSFLLNFSGLYVHSDPIPPFDMNYAKFSGLSVE